MPQYLVKTVVEHYDADEFAAYIAEQQNEPKKSLTEAITAYGILTIGAMCTEMVIVNTKVKTGKILSLVNGLYWGANDIWSAITNSITEAEMKYQLNRMGDGDTLRVTTNYYEYISASGNSYTQWAETNYLIG